MWHGSGEREAGRGSECGIARCSVAALERGRIAERAHPGVSTLELPQADLCASSLSVGSIYLFAHAPSISATPSAPRMLHMQHLCVVIATWRLYGRNRGSDLQEESSQSL